MDLKVITHPSSFELGTKALLEYCEKENINLKDNDVLYFPFDRRISISKEEMEACDILNLIIGKTSIREQVEKVFDISDSFKWDEWELNKKITCGYEQIMNLFYKIIINQPKILVIDHIEKNLHILLTLYLIRILNINPNINKLIITIYQDDILEIYKEKY